MTVTPVMVAFWVVAAVVDVALILGFHLLFRYIDRRQSEGKSHWWVVLLSFFLFIPIGLLSISLLIYLAIFLL